VKTCVIYNPAAGAAERIAELSRVVDGMELARANCGQECERRAAIACDRGFEIVVAAGGDGTIHHVVNGLMSSGKAACGRPLLGILPLGTGNDLARTISVPADDPPRAIRLIREPAQIRTLDLVKIRAGNRPTRYGVNVAAGGFTGQMNEAMTERLKQTWGPLSYLRGAIKVLPDLTNYRTTIRFDGSAAQNICAMNVIIANGRFAGAGIHVAPLANPEDGLLDVVVINSGSVLELTALAAKLLSNGDYLDARIVTHRRAKRVAIESTPGMWFSIDGELTGNEPTTFSVEPQALRVIVGPDYQ
jgi:diacylglycerol kinase (ATP)